MMPPQVLLRNLSVDPDCVHGEDFGIEMNVVHVPDDNRQEGEDGFEPMYYADYVERPYGDQRD